MLTRCKGELPNVHLNCVRSLLGSLVCLDHDLQRICIELRNLEDLYKREIDKIEKPCTMLRSIVCDECADSSVDRSDELREFSKHIATIDEVNECFKQKIEKVKQQREQVLNNGRELMLKLQAEKCRFKRFHDKTIEHLKSKIIHTDNPDVIHNCEKDIQEMQRLFAHEVLYIKNTENDLRWFINNLKDADIEYFCQCCCFKEYDWIPKGKNFGEVDEVAKEFKATMGETLKRAYAQLHIHKAEDRKAFLAGYLYNVQENENRLAEKLNLFANCKEKDGQENDQRLAEKLNLYGTCKEKMKMGVNE